MELTLQAMGERLARFSAMGLFSAGAQPVAGGYDAVKEKGRRRPVLRTTRTEDDELRGHNRRALTATSRDVVRNFSIARWMVQKHLDYVSSFSFQAATGDAELDNQLEAFMGRWQSRHRCDVARRHPLRRLIRLVEARAVVDGDALLVKVAGPQDAESVTIPGAGPLLEGKLQAVEGDRIVATSDIPDSLGGAKAFPSGVQLAAGGAAIAYHVAKRGEGTRLEFGRVVPASSCFFYAKYDRFDQVRGVSPLASALNTLQDVYEGSDYMLAKLKVHQMFGLAIYRSSDEVLGQAVGADENGEGGDETQVDMGRGPFQLDLDEKDRDEFLESRTPAAESVAFLQTMTQVALKALGIPYSFFDESHTNFYGSRGGLIQYLKGCRTTIADLQELLDDVTRWRLGLAVAQGEIELPAGVQFADLKWEWVPDGVPWWDPVKEVTGVVKAIENGLTTHQRACREAGTDFYENVTALAKENAFAESLGVKLGAVAPMVAAVDSPPDEQDDEQDDAPDQETDQ
jgi:capsid protein